MTNQKNLKKPVCNMKVFNQTIDTLSPYNHIDNPEVEATILLTHILECNKNDLYLSDKAFEISDLHLRKLSGFIKRRLQGEPLQYITGSSFFRHLELEVNQSVLIPRPETEQIIDIIKQIKFDKETIYYADIGTGSGAIALSLALEIPNSVIYAIDKSSDALKTMEKNLKNISDKNFGIAEKIFIYRGDLIKPLSDNNLKVDVMVANLPYIPEEDYGKLPIHIKNFEPKSALYGGADGLKYIKNLIDSAWKVINPKGYLFLEIGIDQSQKVTDYLYKNVHYSDINIFKDYANIDRFIGVRIIHG